MIQFWLTVGDYEYIIYAPSYGIFTNICLTLDIQTPPEDVFGP